MEIIRIYIDAIEREIMLYQENGQSRAKLMKRIEKHKADFHSLYRNRNDAKETLKEFDDIYREIVKGVEPPKLEIDPMSFADR